MGVHPATQTFWLRRLTCQPQLPVATATEAPTALEALRGAVWRSVWGLQRAQPEGLSREASVDRGISLRVSNQQKLNGAVLERVESYN